MIESFSKKQKMVLSWWQKDSAFCQNQAIICDGSIRSGKTFSMTLSFFLWAFSAFSGERFALCGKSRASVQQNILEPILPILKLMGFSVREDRGRHFLEISIGEKSNRFYLFSGKDEGSASYIQGITLAGVLFDEIVLLPRSFVEQALARCSVGGSRFWMSCNPGAPSHWFYEEWIKKRKEKKVFYLHFTMNDNPVLTKEIKERYHTLYSGVFYKRFIEGKWVAADGLIYPRFEKERHVVSKLPTTFSKYYISCDYGTVNPCSMGLWGQQENCWYRMREEYFDSRKEGFQKTDKEHFDTLLNLACDKPIEAVIVDPSAASFMEWIRRDGRFKVWAADNRVLYGIQKVSEALADGQLLFSDQCQDSIREFSLYSWKDGKETVCKENDHAMDEIRYFVLTVLAQEPEIDDFFVGAIARQ